jgi:hypothetical protein
MTRVGGGEEEGEAGDHDIFQYIKIKNELHGRKLCCIFMP